MNEEAVVFGSQSLVGVLCQPAQTKAMAVIFVNAGNTHRCGPNRLYVSLARRLAARGYVSLRFDVSGIGDSPQAGGLGRFRDYAARQVREAMDHLQARGCRQFVVLGLCGGADIAFDAGAADERAAGLILVNGAFVDGDAFASLYHMASRRTASRFYAARILSPRRWWRLITFQSRFWNRLFRHRGTPPPAHLACGRPTNEMPPADSRFKWAALARRKADVLLVYSEGSVFWDMYKAASRDHLKASYPPHRLTVAFHKNADHTFTLLSAQDRLANQIERWLDAMSPGEGRTEHIATPIGARA